MTKNTILVTTDGSTAARTVIPHAVRMAEALAGELLLLRVLTPALDCGDVLALTLDEAVPVVAERWSRELATMLVDMKAAGRSVVEVRRHGEDIKDAILRVALDEGAELVAMSSRGSGVVRHAILGSVALSVLGKTSTPVLMAGAHISSSIGRGAYHIVVTTDGSGDATRAVDAVVAFSVHHSIKVSLLRVHVPSPNDRGDVAETAAATEMLARLREKFPNPEAVGIVVRSLGTSLGGVDTAILNAAAELGATAIAISTHGHSAKYHALMGSTALGVLRQSTLPLLLVRSAPAATS